MNAVYRLLPLIFVMVFAACSSSGEQAQTSSEQTPQTSVRQISTEDLEIVKGPIYYPYLPEVDGVW